jgi:hypothetical protein
MVTPREQKEMVLEFDKKTDFVEAFNKKYGGTMPFAVMTARMRSLWDRRHVHALEIKVLRERERVALITKETMESERNHTVMIPARIVSKHQPSPDTLPDVGEILIRTNHLLAELVQLQKEQLALFKEIQGGKK